MHLPFLGNLKGREKSLFKENVLKKILRLVNQLLGAVISWFDYLF